VHSRRTLGAVALGALAVAAVSFAVVDVSTSLGSRCAPGDDPCTAPGAEIAPVVAVCAAALGGLALLAALVPAIMWITAAVRTTRHPDDDELRDAHRRALHGDDDPLRARRPGDDDEPGRDERHDAD
jgi:hypothetical protein